jgi:hypothetical protein
MSEIPEIPIEELKESAADFELGNVKLELQGTLERLKGNSEALSQLHALLSDALEQCSQALSEQESAVSSNRERRIPQD